VDNEFFMSLGDRWRAQREEVRQQLGFPPGLPTVLYSGKFTPRKRPMDLIEAASRVRTALGILFVGDGPLRSALESEVLRRKLKYVRFVGFQNQSALPRFLAAADIFACPSSYESYGLAVNEAMCMELPVLATTAVSAAADLVRNGENGFLFPVGDVEALAQRLDQLAVSPEICGAMGRRSREMIRDWNYDACVEGVLDALEYVGGMT
jgi:glycosyltransferase involved in cell wall biosynthesis